MRRVAQAPIKETIIGNVEFPSPRSPPVSVSITPHKKYGQQTQNKRSVPAVIAAELSVYTPSNGPANT